MAEGAGGVRVLPIASHHLHHGEDDVQSSFNPLHYRMLFECPRRLSVHSAWNEHVPFGMMLVEMQRPSVVVELGTHHGVSYCGFCQAVQTLKTSTRCFAVDTWTGDREAGFYGNEVYEDLHLHHQRYQDFSTLLRMTFDDAIGQFSDRSVDLLHIDGLHAYAAVRRDYEAWFPKLTDRGVVLFHDTAVMDRGFGVHVLWSELKRKFPSCEFEHGSGLGLLAVGGRQPPELLDFLTTAAMEPHAIQGLFSALGQRLLLKVEKETHNRLMRARSSTPPPL
jgi:O-antigen biosynthesis protein